MNAIEHHTVVARKFSKARAHALASELEIKTNKLATMPGHSSGRGRIRYTVKKGFLHWKVLEFSTHYGLSARKGETNSAMLDDGRTATVRVDSKGRSASFTIE